MFKAAITCLLGSAIIGLCGSAHADWAVRGRTLIGAVSTEAASEEPNGAYFSATCIKGSAGLGLISLDERAAEAVFHRVQLRKDQRAAPPSKSLVR